MMHYLPPKILIIDDVCGRSCHGEANQERASLCAQFLLRDITHAPGDGRLDTVSHPVADAVFYRGQQPALAQVGDVVKNDIAGCVQVVRDGWEPGPAFSRRWALVLLDLSFRTGLVTAESDASMRGMPTGDPSDSNRETYFGLQLLSVLHDSFPDLPLVMFSSMPRDEISLEFARNGASGFLSRDSLDGHEQLRDLLSRHGLIEDDKCELIGSSRPFLLALRDARRLAGHGMNVLIRGERGVGKELFARYIHRRSGTNHNRPFVAVNSAIFTPELFASELFGIDERTATGVSAKAGLVESASGGTLFLDEIRDMPGQVQAGILRVMQDRQITRIGSRTPRRVDVRFLAATNFDIEFENSFRRDLLDRLRNGGIVHIPPLRDRLDDLRTLVEVFLSRVEAANSRFLRRTATDETIDKLAGYPWPGNVRELESVILEAVASHPDVEHLVPSHVRLPSSFKSNGPLAAASPEAHLSPHSALDDALAALRAARFRSEDPIDWSGRYPHSLDAIGEFLLNYLRAALTATMRRTPQNPNGQLVIRAAARLMTGDPSISTSSAADLVKRIVGFCPFTTKQAALDQTLSSAYDVAIRLRPRVSKVGSGKKHA